MLVLLLYIFLVSLVVSSLYSFTCRRVSSSSPLHHHYIIIIIIIIIIVFFVSASDCLLKTDGTLYSSSRTLSRPNRTRCFYSSSSRRQSRSLFELRPSRRLLRFVLWRHRWRWWLLFSRFWRFGCRVTARSLDFGR